MLVFGEGSDSQQSPQAPPHGGANASGGRHEIAALVRERRVHVTLGLVFYACALASLAGTVIVARWVLTPITAVFLIVTGEAGSFKALGSGTALALVFWTMLASCAVPALAGYVLRSLIREGQERFRTATNCTMTIAALSRVERPKSLSIKGSFYGR